MASAWSSDSESNLLEDSCSTPPLVPPGQLDVANEPPPQAIIFLLPSPSESILDPYIPPPDTWSNPPFLFGTRDADHIPPLPLVSPAWHLKPRTPPLGTNVEILISNIEPEIDPEELRSILIKLFCEHVEVLLVCVFYLVSGEMGSFVRVRSYSDAFYVMTRLQRAMVGNQRIILTLSPNRGHLLFILRCKVYTLIRETPTKEIYLTELHDLFFERFQSFFEYTDLFTMRDLLQIHSPDEDGRILIQLLGPEGKMPIVPGMNAQGLDSSLDFCPLHSSRESSRSWSETDEPESYLPFVLIRLPELDQNLALLLKTHGGSVPISGLLHCYNSEVYPPLLPEMDWGVPLEHLISCLKGYEIRSNPQGYKRLYFKGETFESAPRVRAELEDSIFPEFAREVTEFLKDLPGALFKLKGFQGAYQARFCRPLLLETSFPGYKDLSSVFKAMPETVQLLGCGSEAVLTLSHPCQVQRFTEDILFILRNHPSHSFYLHEFGPLYTRNFGFPLSIRDYGICSLEDILGHIPRSSGIHLRRAEVLSNSLVSLIQESPGEAIRLSTFSNEILELLSSINSHRVPLGELMSEYQRYFGRRLWLRHFGVFRVVELVESVPSSLRIRGGEALGIVVPSMEELLDIYRERILKLLRCREGMCPATLLGCYLDTYGEDSFRVEEAGFKDFRTIVERFVDEKILTSTGEDYGKTKLYYSSETRERVRREIMKRMLSEAEGGILTLEALMDRRDRFIPYTTAETNKADIRQTANELGKKWADVYTNHKGEEVVRVRPVKLVQYHILQLLEENRGSLSSSEVEKLYNARYCTKLDPRTLGFNKLSTFFKSMTHDPIPAKWRAPRRLVLYNNHLLFVPLNSVLQNMATSSPRRGLQGPTFSGAVNPLAADGRNGRCRGARGKQTFGNPGPRRGIFEKLRTTAQLPGLPPLDPVLNNMGSVMPVASMPNGGGGSQAGLQSHQAANGGEVYVPYPFNSPPGGNGTGSGVSGIPPPLQPISGFHNPPPGHVFHRTGFPPTAFPPYFPPFGASSSAPPPPGLPPPPPHILQPHQRANLSRFYGNPRGSHLKTVNTVDRNNNITGNTTETTEDNETPTPNPEQ